MKVISLEIASPCALTDEGVRLNGRIGGELRGENRIDRNEDASTQPCATRHLIKHEKS